MKKTICLTAAVLFTLVSLQAKPAPASKSGTKSKTTAASTAKGVKGTQKNGSGGSSKNPSNAKKASPEKKSAAAPGDSLENAIQQGNLVLIQKYIDGGEVDAARITKAKTVMKSYTNPQQSGVAQFQSGRMDSRVRNVPPEIQENIFIKPKETIQPLVHFLVNGKTDTLGKVKVMHDWICDNIAYDADLFFSGKVSGQDYVTVLKKRKAVCSGYASLVNEMCRIAGIESVGIQGFSKGYGYSGVPGKKSDHEWNAVRADGHWYLLDACWDAGFLEYKTYIKHYSTDYLFLAPRQFLYTHLPEKDQFQFYYPLLTKDGFAKEPKLEGKFFRCGLSILSKDFSYMNVSEEEFVLRLKGASGQTVFSSVYRDRQQVEGAAWSQRKQSGLELRFDMPSSGSYECCVSVSGGKKYPERIPVGEWRGFWIPSLEKLLAEKKITAKEKEWFETAYFEVEENGIAYLHDDQFASSRNAALEKISLLLRPGCIYTDNVLVFRLSSSSYKGFGEGKMKYPHTYPAYMNSAGIELVSPLTGKLRAGSHETIRISSTSFTGFAVVYGGKWNMAKKNPESGLFELEVDVPSDPSLVIMGTKNGRNYESLVMYMVEAD